MSRIINHRKFLEEIQKAATAIYIPALRENTPGTMRVADEWEVETDDKVVYIVNKEFGDIVTWLTEGTSPHFIRAKPGGWLKFPKPKNEPKIKHEKPLKGNRAFEKDGYIFTKVVRHPGIVARKFVDEIINDKQLEERFIDRLKSFIAKSLEDALI